MANYDEAYAAFQGINDSRIEGKQVEVRFEQPQPPEPKQFSTSPYHNEQKFKKPEPSSNKDGLKQVYKELSHLLQVYYREKNN